MQLNVALPFTTKKKEVKYSDVLYAVATIRLVMFYLEISKQYFLLLLICLTNPDGKDLHSYVF